MYILESNICKVPSILKIIDFITRLLDIVFIIIPIVLIIMLTIDFFKIVMSGNEESMKKLRNLAIRRIIMCIALFLVPKFVYASLDLVETASGGTLKIYKECKENIKNIDKIEAEYNNKKEQERLAREERYQKELEKLRKEEQFKVGNKSNKSENSEKTNNGASKWKYYNQHSGWGKNCSGSNTMSNSGCGITSFAIVANALSGKKVTPANVRDFVCNNGHSGNALHYSWFTKSKLLNKYNLKSNQLFYHGYNGHKNYKSAEANRIKKAVEKGHGVVLFIPGHYVAVGPGKDCGKKEVYLYDVSRKKYNGCYTMKKLWKKTKNYQNRCTNKGRCGWLGAWEFQPK